VVTFERVLGDGLVACVPFTIVIWATFLTMPRLWLHSLPEDIQGMAAPKTDGEKRLTGIMGVVVLLLFFGVPIGLTLRFNAESGGTLAIPQILLYLYGVWMTINLWDLVAIDWVYALLVDPQRPPIVGTVGAKGYKDYGFHFKSFVKASVFSLLLLVPAAVVISLV